MSDQKRFTTEEVEPLVRSYLAQCAAETDPTQSIDRFRSTVAAFENSSRRSVVAHARPYSTLARWAFAVATVAAIMLAILAADGGREVHASAAGALRDARNVLDMRKERCYLVQVFRSPGPAESSIENGMDAASLPPVVNRLWVRGDCFLIRPLSSDLQWVYGRDQQGRIWLSDGHHVAVEFQPDELPPALKEEPSFASDVVGIPMRRLLAEFLRDFTIRYSEESAPSLRAESATVTVRVDAKGLPVHEQLRGATLEIDRRDNVIRRMTLEKQRAGGRVLNYVLTLLDVQQLAEEDYQVESHLREPYEVFSGRNQPERREEWIERWNIPSLRQGSQVILE